VALLRGSTLTIHVIDTKDECSSIELGATSSPGIAAGGDRSGLRLRATVERPGTFALVGCTAAPGFDFQDFEMPKRDELLARYPQHQGIIERLTR